MGTSGQSVFEKGWVRVLVFIPIYLVVLLITQVIALLLLFAFSDLGIENIGSGLGDLMSLPSLLIFQSTTTLGALALVWVFSKNIDRISLPDIGLQPNKGLKSGLLGFFLGIGLIGGGFGLLYAGGYVTVNTVQFSPVYLMGYAIFTFLVSMNEEVVVRGYVLRNLMDSMNRWNALAISAGIFTLLHSFNPGMSALAVLNLFLAGLLLGIYYVYRKNLWFPIMLHLSWNFFQGSVFGFEVSGVAFSNPILTQRLNGPAWLTGGAFGFEGSVLLTALLVLSLVALHWYFKQKEASEAL